MPKSKMLFPAFVIGLIFIGAAVLHGCGSSSSSSTPAKFTIVGSGN